MSAVNKLHLLNHSIPWFGQRSGYSPLLIEKLQAMDVPLQTWQTSDDISSKLCGKALSLKNRWGHANQAEIWVEWRYTKFLAKKTWCIGHIPHGEERWRIWKHLHTPTERLVATFHQPRSNWPSVHAEIWEKIQNVILLYQRDWEFFQDVFPNANLHFIRHGVDTEFFQPGKMNEENPHLVYAGVHLRNTKMLGRIVKVLLQKHSRLHIDLIVLPHRRNEEGLKEIAELNSSRIHWHAGLSDEELLRVYQNAAALLLPMNDSGANNALLEGLACGLPIITTDVGGVRDYGGGEVYPLISNNDDDAMIDVLDSILTNNNLQKQYRSSSRQFAIDKLSWKAAALAHTKVYSQML